MLGPRCKGCVTRGEVERIEGMPREHPQPAVPSPALSPAGDGAGTACLHTSTHSIPSNLPSFLIKVLPEGRWRRMCVHLCTQLLQTS